MGKVLLHRWSPLVSLLLGLLLASWLGIALHRVNESDIDESFESFAQRVTLQLQRRMQLYELGLKGARGALLTGGEERIGRKQFEDYSRSRDYAREFPGARGFGFIRRVPKAQEAEFVQFAQGDGWPDFSIHQLTPHEGERYVIQYIEPVNGNEAAVGLDIASEDNRRRAALQSLRTGVTVITDPITLVQVDGKKNQGFLVLLAAYRNGLRMNTDTQRESAGYGWVYAPLFIEEVLKDFDFFDQRLAIQASAVNATGAPTPFYTSPGMVADGKALRQSTRSIQVFGREWEVTVQARPELAELLNLPSPWFAFGLVFLFSLAGTLATYVLQSKSARIDRMAADSRLNETNRRYRQLIDGVKDYAIIQLDTEGRVTGWNSGAEHIKGYTAAEITGQHLSIFYPEEEKAKGDIGKKLETARTQGLEHEEGWRVRKDGSRFWASVTISPMYDDEGHLSGYSKITRDLSERRTHEQELKRLVGLQTAILDNAGSAIIATAMDGIITLFNPGAERLLGYHRDEVIGKLTPLAFHDRKEVADMAAQLSDELGISVKPGLATLGARALRGDVDTHEWTYITKEGRRTPVLLSITAIFDDHGTPLGTVGLAADLSEQKRYQAELVAARVQAERATAAKSSFLANMSHEIRTPMNAILGMTQLVLQGTLEPQQRSQLDKAFTASKALLNILNDVLDYSKVEAGHLQLEVRELSLETLLASSASLFTHQAEQKGLELILDVPPDLPDAVMGDPLRLTQVLSNLLSNALKFTSQGTVTLRVRVLYQDLQLCRLRLAVVDTGIGMNRAQIAQLFQPFTQADASVTRRYGGTGLGLSICKRLVELMGGSIEVNSTPATGSEFSFEMDMALVKPSQLQHRRLRRLPFQRALVVDDQIAAAHVLQAMLRGWNVSVACCDAGLPALDQLKTASAQGTPFDLVLTDWRMPGLDGLGLIDQIGLLHSNGLLAKMPAIVLVSSYDMQDIPEQLRERPVTALLAKPVLPSALHDALAGERDSTISSADVRAPRPATKVHDYITSAASLRGHHILLAEDNEVNQQVACAFLKSAGLQVSVAGNGVQAVEMAKTGKYSAILMDMHMPEMDGLEATRVLRSMRAGESVPIIAMTAAVLQDDRQACFDAGMDGFVGKPIDPQELMTALRQWIKPDAQANLSGPSHASETATVLGQLAQLSGLDLASALARMGGNQGMLLRLLRGFAERAPAQADQLNGISTEQLSLWLHTLKGESANLGVTTIEAYCKTIEEVLSSEPHQRPDELLTTLGNYLRAFSREMAHSLDEDKDAMQNGDNVSTSQNIPQEIKAMLDELPVLLSEQRMQALRHSEKLLDRVKGTHLHSFYVPVHALVEQLQFAAALQALNGFTDQLNK